MKTRSIKAVADKNSMTYDIVKTFDDGTATIYRTSELTEGEFEDFQHNTASDLQSYLNTDNSYYEVKQ